MHQRLKTLSIWLLTIRNSLISPESAKGSRNKSKQRREIDFTWKFSRFDLNLQNKGNAAFIGKFPCNWPLERCMHSDCVTSIIIPNFVSFFLFASSRKTSTNLFFSDSKNWYLIITFTRKIQHAVLFVFRARWSLNLVVPVGGSLHAVRLNKIIWDALSSAGWGEIIS